MKKIKSHLITFLIIPLIFIITIIDILNKDISFSNYENRSLAMKPKFYYDDFKSGIFFKNYNRYINDQFLFRDEWINIKSISEYLVAKKENNGIIYGKNDFLFDKFEKVDENMLSKNLEIIKNFINSSKANFNIMIVPESFSIYKEYLPYGLNLINEEDYINKINSSFNELNNTNIINLFDLFKENKDKYIYYKTDHHWTSLGAYLAYKELAISNNKNPIEIKNLTENRVEDFLGTYFSKSKNFNVKKDYILYYENNNLNIDVEINGVKVDDLNDNSKWESSDKYSAFLNGNNALTVIKNNSIENDSKILVIKDSFANSIIQFLINDYREVYVVDLRSFPSGFNYFFIDNNFSNVLLLYSFKNLSEDVNISKLKY